MVVRYLGDGEWKCLDADSKPANASVGDKLTVSDTRRVYIKTGPLSSDWMDIEHNPMPMDMSNISGPTFIVYQKGSDYEARDTRTGMVESTDTDPWVPIQYALNNLTELRNWKETVKLRGYFSFPTITIPSYTVLDLTEAGLFQTGATNDNFIRNADTTNGNTNIEIFGGIIDGNKDNQAAGGTEDGQSMLEFMKCSNIWIHNTRLQYGDFHNIRFKECPTDIKVTEITSIEARHEHISDHAQLSAQGVCRGHFICNSYFENTLAGQTPIASVNVSDYYVIGNYVNKCFGPTTGIAMNGIRSYVIGNTVIDASGVGIYLAQASDVDFDSSDSVVANNVVINAASYGIAVSGYPCKGILFSNNRVHSGGSAQAAGIYSLNCQNILISNNIVSNRGGNGIYVVGVTATPSKRIKVIGNMCYNNGQAVAGAGHQAGIAAISFSAPGDNSYVTIENNDCFDNQGTKTQLHGVRISNVPNAVIRFNDLRDNGTSGYIASGDQYGNHSGR